MKVFPTSACFFVAAVALTGCGAPSDDSPSTHRQLVSAVESLIHESGADVGFFYRSTAETGDSVVINGDLRMHAASTMKVPVMMRLFMDQDEGLLLLSDSLPIRTEFRSIVDDSLFELPSSSDSDTTFYQRVGESAPISEMVDRMITWSSNLATNILIEEAEADRVNAMLRDMGADSIEVLRGVEDLKAFEAGLSNTTTARDLGRVMLALVDGTFEEASASAMVAILENQHFRENIPAGLPEGTRVANKTGWITGINHDAALVFPSDRPPYALVILVRDHPAEDQGEALAQALSRVVWEYHNGLSLTGSP